jgi:lysozyme
MVTVDVSQGQFDALVSFVYNVGAGAFENSTLLEKLNAGDYRGAFDEFERWNKVTVNGEKIVSSGLVKRRRREQELFLA